MKRYFDIYIRLAATAIDPDDIGVTNVLEDWDRLELADAKATLSLEPESKELNDGTLYVEAETGSFQAATLKVDKTEWEYLRTTFHGKKCDVLLYDPSDNSMLAAMYRLDMDITQVLEVGESVMIKVSGKRSMSPDAVDNALSLMAPGLVADMALVSGIVYEHDGVTPLAGVTVTLDDGEDDFSDDTDKDGNYLLLVPAAEAYDVTAAKTGGWEFPAELTITPVKDAENTLNITATVDAGS